MWPQQPPPRAPSSLPGGEYHSSLRGCANSLIGQVLLRLRAPAISLERSVMGAGSSRPNGSLPGRLFLPPACTINLSIARPSSRHRHDFLMGLPSPLRWEPLAAGSPPDALGSPLQPACASCRPPAQAPGFYLLEALTQVALILRVAEFQNVLSQKILKKETSRENPRHCFPSRSRRCWTAVLLRPLHPPSLSSPSSGERGRRMALGRCWSWPVPCLPASGALLPVLISPGRWVSTFRMWFYFGLPSRGKL